MEYRFALPGDLQEWLEVAEDVGTIMRVPNMRTDANFIEYAKRKLEQNNAIIACDLDRAQCAGFIGFSRNNNSITWLGIKSLYRNKGVGSKLLSLALCELDARNRITVNTYPSVYIPGKPARNLYSKHGFIEVNDQPFIIDNLEMVELSIMPNRAL